MKEEWKVGRVIARPYIGEQPGSFKRTSNRHDYALAPFDKTTLDYLKESGVEVISVGKINDIFSGQGITKAIHTINNEDGMNQTIELANQSFKGLVFTNLVDFDAMYGHRRNPLGYKDAIEAFDLQLCELMHMLKDDDLLMITADHGNDPTYKGTDHTREQVPLLIYSKKLKESKNLGILDSFACIGNTIAENFNIQKPQIGHSFLGEL